jgi:hypothetical protein
MSPRPSPSPQPQASQSATPKPTSPPATGRHACTTIPCRQKHPIQKRKVRGEFFGLTRRRVSQHCAGWTQCVQPAKSSRLHDPGAGHHPAHHALACATAR